MLWDHVGFNVKDVAASRSFYVAALAPLGVFVLMEDTGWAMLGRPGEGAFWFGQFGAPASPIHLAFAAKTRAEVRAFHAAALAAGGRDNGGPGIRADYHPNYYGAFVYDPDGHNIEAVCHLPESEAGA
jgi:catechol 2,3-dioxygenase-like lactoylglutathione lyase family enzyme